MGVKKSENLSKRHKIGFKTEIKPNSLEEILTDISVDNIKLVPVLVEELLVLRPEVDLLLEGSQNVAMGDFFVGVEIPKPPESADKDTHEEQEL